MDTRIANSEYPDLTDYLTADLGLRCLYSLFRQATSVRNFRTLTVLLKLILTSNEKLIISKTHMGCYRIGLVVTDGHNHTKFATSVPIDRQICPQAHQHVSCYFGTDFVVKYGHQHGRT